MKKSLMIAGMFCACSAFADPVVLDGNYVLETTDPKCTSGSYEVGWELQPKDGVVIAGSDWHVKHILAFQQNGISMTLQSGTLVIDHGDYNGCYPNNGASWVNLPDDSTATVTMPFAAGEIYSRCFSQGNFRVGGRVLTEPEFALKITCESVDSSHTRFSIREGKATDVFMSGISLSVANPGVVDAEVTFGEGGRGDGTASLYVAWDLSDRGTSMDAWANHVSLGAVGDFSGTEQLSNLPQRTDIFVRFFAIVGDESFFSPGASIFSMYLEDEDVAWTGNSETDVFFSGRALGFNMSGDKAVKHLELAQGSYVFPGTSILSVYDGVTVDDAYVLFHNQIGNQSDNAVFAFTNAFIQYRGTNGYGSINPFTTGSGKDGVRVEMVNTTDHAEGMLWDCMTDGIKIGLNASDCFWLVDGGDVTAGAVVTNMDYNKRGFHLGEGAGASRNQTVLRGGAFVRDDITVNNAGNNIGDGAGANDNRLDIIGGEGFVTKLYKAYPGSIGRGAATGNVVRVDGKGFPGSAVWDNRSESLVIGNVGAFSNSLYIVDGGIVSGPVVNVGNDSISNLVVVSGEGSVLRGSDGSTAITVGTGGSSAYSAGNRLIVENGGIVERFAKWSTVIGGHESNGMTGSSIDNGVIVRSGGKFKLANHLRIGQIKGTDSITKGNFVHVQGAGSEVVQTGGNREIYIGAATLSGDPGAEACENELVVSDGGVVTASKYFVGGSVSETAPGASHDNRIVATANGKIVATEFIQVGLSADASRGAEEAVVVNNKVIAENGGIIEAKTLATISGNGNAIIARNGGVFQFFNAEPGIEPFEEGAIAIDSGVISYRMNNCTPTTVETSTKAKSWQALTVTGKNAFRLTECQTRDWDNSYTFGDTEPANPRHFVRLEMVGGTTAWRGGASDTLTIDTTGSMLCSNTTATISVPFALNGPLSICNSTLSFTQAATLDAQITIHAADGELEEPPLVLSADTTLGEHASIVVTGEVADGMVVYQSNDGRRCPVSMPSGYSVRSEAHEDAFWHVARKQNGLSVIVR